MVAFKYKVLEKGNCDKVSLKSIINDRYSLVVAYNGGVNGGVRDITKRHF